MTSTQSTRLPPIVLGIALLCWAPGVSAARDTRWVDGSPHQAGRHAGHTTQLSAELVRGCMRIVTGPFGSAPRVVGRAKRLGRSVGNDGPSPATLATTRLTPLKDGQTHGGRFLTAMGLLLVDVRAGKPHEVQLRFNADVPPEGRLLPGAGMVIYPGNRGESGPRKVPAEGYLRLEQHDGASRVPSLVFRAWVSAGEQQIQQAVQSARLSLPRGVRTLGVELDHAALANGATPLTPFVAYSELALPPAATESP